MDIVEQLRNNKGGESYTWKTISEAANEIERMQEWNDNVQEKLGGLEAEIKRLREALIYIRDDRIINRDGCRKIAEAALKGDKL
jgi:hypothetical protein